MGVTAVPIKHLAIIMDGNNRWARQRNLPGNAGHKMGIERLRDMLVGCRDYEIEVLTVFAFSSENWRRNPLEVNALMSLFYQYLTNESKKLKNEGIKLNIIGSRARYDKRLLKALEKAESITARGERVLNIAADYGGRWDIVQAAKRLLDRVQADELCIDDIDETHLAKHIALAEFPPLDLLIRTGGEYRISNFLLWQAAYAEFFFSDLLWPDFDRRALDAAIESFACRERRFGYSGDQVTVGEKNQKAIDDVVEKVEAVFEGDNMERNAIDAKVFDDKVLNQKVV